MVKIIEKKILREEKGHGRIFGAWRICGGV